jgi:hypothetical protein
MKTEQEIDSRCERVIETKKTNGKRKPGAKIKQEKLCTLESQPGARTDACPKINGKTN